MGLFDGFKRKKDQQEEPPVVVVATGTGTGDSEEGQNTALTQEQPSEEQTGSVPDTEAEIGE